MAIFCYSIYQEHNFSVHLLFGFPALVFSSVRWVGTQRNPLWLSLFGIQVRIDRFQVFVEPRQCLWIVGVRSSPSDSDPLGGFSNKWSPRAGLSSFWFFLSIANQKGFTRLGHSCRLIVFGAQSQLQAGVKTANLANRVSWLDMSWVCVRIGGH